MEIFLYIFFTIIFLILAFKLTKAILERKKINGGKKLTKEEKQQHNQEMKVDRTQEKKNMREAYAIKKAEWKQSDKEFDEQVKANVVELKKQVEEAKPKWKELHDKAKASKATLDKLAQKVKHTKESEEAVKEYEAYKVEHEEIYNEYIEYNKEYDRLVQRYRIEKHRASFSYKVERWSKRGGRLRREIYVKRQYYYLVAPYVILFFAFTVVPVLMSLVLSFTNFNLLEFPDFVGWENYMRLFVDDENFLIAIKNTLILAVVTGPLSYLAAFVFAWLINELRPRLRSFMTLVFYAPSISGSAYLVWRLIFSSDSHGYANAYLMKFGLINEPILWLTTEKYILWIIMLVQLWLSLGVSFLAFIAGLQSCDKTLYEAGAIDGIKNRWQELWYITLPQMKSQLMFGAVMQITSSLSIADVSIQMVGFPSVNYAGHTIITHLMDYGSIRMEMGYASAIATVLFAIMILANMLVRKILRRVGS